MGDQTNQDNTDDVNHHNLNVWMTQVDEKLRVWEKQRDINIALLQGAFDFASLAIKNLLIFNGGAILALLTFYGNVLVSDNRPKNVDVSMLSQSVRTFVLGAAAGLVCAMFAYFSQILFSELNNVKLEKIFGGGFRLLAIIAAVFSFFYFVDGALIAASALSGIK